MDPDAAGPTARCVTDAAAREAHQWASDVPGGPEAQAVVAAHKEARYWCDRCYVRDECLAFALGAEGKTDERARDGVYGGQGPTQRAALAGVAPKKKPKAPKGRPPRSCTDCGSEFTPRTNNAKYCGKKSCGMTSRREAQARYDRARYRRKKEEAAA